MARTKTFSKTLSNFDPLLQNIRTCLGENYAFYQECIVAITSAAARHDDMSAWLEQMQQVVEGVEAVGFSHAGVLFLVHEKIRGEAALVNEMGPAPLLLGKISTPSQAMDREQQPALLKDFAASVINTPLSASFSHPATPTSNVASRTAHNSPPMGLKEHSQDPFLFVDPAMKQSVRDFFGVTPLNDNSANHERSQQQDTDDTTSYYDSKETMASYNPAADDVKDFKERSEGPDMTQDNELMDKSDCGERAAESDRLRRDLGLFNEY